jgi:hypothetical protein
MVSQTAWSRKRFTATLFNAYKRLFTRVRPKMFRQRATLQERLSTSWLSANEWFFAGMRSKMFR